MYNVCARDKERLFIKRTKLILAVLVNEVIFESGFRGSYQRRTSRRTLVDASCETLPSRLKHSLSLSLSLCVCQC